MNNTVIEHLIKDELLESTVIIVMVVVAFLKIIRENYDFFTNRFKFDHRKKIDRLKQNLNDINENDELFRSILEHEINNYVFASSIGYYLEKSKQEDYLRFYDLVKEKISLKDFKVIFRNSKIWEGIININIGLTTRIDIYGQFGFGCFLLFLGIILLFLSFYIPNPTNIKQVLVALLYMTSLIFGLLLLLDSLRMLKTIKEVKSEYNNYELYSVKEGNQDLEL